MGTYGLVATADGTGRSYQLEQYNKNVSEGLRVFTSLRKYLHCRENFALLLFREIFWKHICGKVLLLRANYFSRVVELFLFLEIRKNGAELASPCIEKKTTPQEQLNDFLTPHLWPQSPPSAL